MADEDEEAARRAVEGDKDRTPSLPERLRFKGLIEALQLLYMRASNADNIRERIEAAMLFISTVAEMLDAEGLTDKCSHDSAKTRNAESCVHEDAKHLHEFVTNYRRPRFRRSLSLTQDGIPVRVIEEPGSEKSRHQFMTTDYRPVVDLLDEGLAEHFIKDVVPWFTAATQLARQHKYLREEGEKLDMLDFDVFEDDEEELVDLESEEEDEPEDEPEEEEPEEPVQGDEE